VGDGEALLLPLRLGETVKGETLPLAVAVVDSVADGVAEASAVTLADGVTDTSAVTLADGDTLGNALGVVDPVADGVSLVDGELLAPYETEGVIDSAGEGEGVAPIARASSSAAQSSRAGGMVSQCAPLAVERPFCERGRRVIVYTKRTRRAKECALFLTRKQG
jgi:hypothetical protein